MSDSRSSILHYPSSLPLNLNFLLDSPLLFTYITVTLLPGQGYRCATRNFTFNTTRDEELLLVDDPEGTRIKYTYFVTVRNRWFRPIFAWMVKTIGLPFWKRSFINPLESLVKYRADRDTMKL